MSRTSSLSCVSSRGQGGRTQTIAITIGDVAGIGPETIAMLWRDHRQSVRDCVVYGDAAAMQRACDLLGMQAQQIPLRQIGSPLKVQDLPAYATVDAVAGRVAAQAVQAATLDALHGAVAAMVTAPLHKEALHAAGVHYPGHTEMLQALCARHAGRGIIDLPVRMMVANDVLAVVLVSIHAPLRQAIERLDVAGIVQTLRITREHYVHMRGIEPRVAVAGINPHAGEGGLFGAEEQDIIAPAIRQACAQGINAMGPFAADSVFMRARRFREFDVVVAMYHDQGLIPVKYEGVAQGVNITLGLPIIRTSPDHGTAFDIAGKGQAQPEGLLRALQQARSLAWQKSQIHERGQSQCSGALQ